MRPNFALPIFALVLVGCGGEPATQSHSPQETATMNAEPTMEAQASRMSVRSGPAKVPDEDHQRYLALARQAEGAGGGGGGMDGAHDDPFVEWSERQSENISPDQAQRMIKGMLNAGLSADPEDPCARIIAMMEHMDGPLSQEEETRVRQECRRMPRGVTGCLKPEGERTPYERRACRRFLRGPDEDIPDIFGTNGAALRRGGLSKQGPQQVEVEGPIRQE